MTTRSSHRTARRLSTAAAFAVLAAASVRPAIAANPHAGEDAARDARTHRPWWMDDQPAPWRGAAQPSAWSGAYAPPAARAAQGAHVSFPAAASVANTAPTGPQPGAILVPPGDNNYSRGRAVAISGGTAVVASNVNASVLDSSVYVYQGVGTATGSVSQSAQLTSADGQAGQAGDNFGVSLSLAGGLGLVGAPAFSNSGYTPKVYVYNNLSTASGTVTESAQLRPSDATGYTNFGSTVSLSGTSGLVGAYTAGSGAGGGASGEAYLYRNLNTATGTVTENVRLLPSDAATIGITPRFGFNVSLSGNVGLVGAYNATINGNATQGEAYVFRNLDTASGTITENVKLLASDGAATNMFGYNVSLSGSTGVAGAYRATVGSNAYQGAAYVYRNLDTATGTITQNVKLLASDGAANSAFGFSVAESGNVALVGAPALGANGNINTTSTAQGAVYLFRNLDTASGTVTQNVKLLASDGAANDHFGYAMSVDGDRFVIGAPQNQTSQAGKSYTGTLSSFTTLDAGNTTGLISGISFVSQDDWIIGQNTSSNQVTLSAGDTATVTSTGKGVFIGQNAGSNNNRLIIAGTVNANTFTIGNAAGTNTGNALQLGNGGTTGSLPVTATINNSGVLAFNRSNAVVQGTDFNGAALTGTGGVTQLGTGTTTLNAANTYTGPTTVSAGTLQAGSTSAFGNNSAVTMANVSGATLALNNFNTQIGSLSGGGTTGGNVTLGTATLTVGGNNTSPAAYAGGISGTGGLTKLGTGALTLSGTNSYTGATAVNGGTLAINGALSGAGMLTVGSGGTLAGTGTVAGPVAVAAGGTFSPGQLATGKLTLQSSLTLTGATTAAFTLASGTNTQALVSGQVNLGTTSTLSLTLATGFTPAAGAKFYLIDETGLQAAVVGTFANAPTTGSQFTQNGYVFSINYLDRDPADMSNALLNDVSVTVVGAVPEPSTWALLGVGVVGAGILTLRQRRRVAPQA